ncbi:Peroxiredoxin DOT5 like protein [Verticillium longisporum]|uniref:thioredoxin-dependent peroxiredoxin n=1 Tax=Verticillium longisporum TaxID=100787 RepID=A0A8I2ZTL2_VERLO|nr:Peroxiredoxin DOT5 like protein [Verticillium longisporum]
MLPKRSPRSEAGVVLFTYPKASTPGCTTQVCLFRDSYEPLTATGLAIHGLSADSTKANTTFKEKKELPYPLLCDPQRTLIGAIGLKKAPSGTQRGVFVVNKEGKILAAEPGGPAATVEVVKKLVEELSKGEAEGAKE